MRQCRDSQLIDFLNNVRTADIKPCDMDIIQSMITQPDQNEYPHEALHSFVENVNAKRHNQGMLQSFNSISQIVTAIDQLPKNVSHQKINEVLKRNQSETGGLAQNLEIKTGARIMLTVNNDLRNRLLNGQLGTIKYINLDMHRNVTKI